MATRFREGYNEARVRELCQIPIEERRGKTIAEQILEELPTEELTDYTRDWLSKWVHPLRREPKVQDVFQEISMELFGRLIRRHDDGRIRVRHHVVTL
jgi:hypothetical protein